MVARITALLLLAVPLLAAADCPQVEISDDAPSTIRLPAEQASCSADSIFSCQKGSLRISGSVKSLTNGSIQITAYCSYPKSDSDYQKGNYEFPNVHEDDLSGEADDN